MTLSFETLTRAASASLKRAVSTAPCAKTNTLIGPLALLFTMATPLPSLATGTYDITLSWETVTGATSYKLKETFDDTVTYVDIPGETTTSHTLTQRVEGDYTFELVGCLLDDQGQKLCEEVAEYSAPVTFNPADANSSGVWLSKGGVVSDAALTTAVPSASNFNGIMAGSAGVSGGAATYTVPIVVPPGRNGVQPSVSLGYSSRSGNGVAGVGWSLSAGGAVSRCGNTLAQDGFTRHVRLDGNDKLCLNGQRLVPESSSSAYGAVGTEYRTELDSFVRVTQRGGNLASNSAYFEVEYPDGRLQVFGKSSDSRVQPSGASVSNSWLLESEHDAGGQNSISYQYITAGPGEVLLDTIRYTNDGTSENGTRYVAFTYEDRLHESVSYISGAYTTQSKRLKTISTHYTASGSPSTSNRVRQYNLSYIASNSSKRSLLSDVEECGYSAGSACRDALALTWKHDEMRYEVELLATASGEELAPMQNGYTQEISRLVPRGDIDGNGSRDWMTHFINAESESEGVNNFDYGFCPRNSVLKRPVCMEADFDQDGRTDLWRITGSNMFDVGYTFEKNDGSLTTRWGDSIDNVFIDDDGTSRDDELVNIGDYNGDGWPDLIVFRAYDGAQSPGTPAGTLELFEHTRVRATPYNSTGRVLFDVARGDSVQYAGDLNGDGLADFAVSHMLASHFNRSPTFYAVLLTNISSSGQVSVINHTFFPGFEELTDTHDNFSLLADINGDGLSDWVGWAEINSAEVHVKLNQGDGTFGAMLPTGVVLPTLEYLGPPPRPPFEERETITVPLFAHAIQTMDVDGDGTVELIYPGNSANDIAVEACHTFQDYQKPSWNSRTVCGTSILTSHRNTPGADLETVPNSASTDDDRNIYKYRALHFDFDVTGSGFALSGTERATDLVGGSNDVTVIDALGKGLQDLVFVYGCPNDNCEMQTSSAQGEMSGKTVNKMYYNRNYGALASSAIKQNDSYHPIDMLVKAQNGPGVESEWSYRPLSSGQSGFYTADRDQAVDDSHFLFASSMYAVDSFKQSNGRGTSKNETRFGYTSAMYNIEGRGFRGFRKIMETDVARSVVSETTFEQVFPRSSLVTSVTRTEIGAASPFHEVENVWLENTAHNIVGGYHLFNGNMTETTYDLTNPSSLVSTKSVVVNQVDVSEYGNVSESLTTIIDDYGTYTTKEETRFDPQDSATTWWPSKVDETRVTRNVVHTAGVTLHAGTTTEKVVTTHIDTWNTTHRKPQKVTVADGATAQTFSTCNASTLNACSSTEIAYNAYGLPTSQIARGAITTGSANTVSVQQRETRTNYTDDGTRVSAAGYFAHEITQENGTYDLVTTNEYQPQTGLVTRSEDQNRVTVVSTYDSFARPLQSTSSANGIAIAPTQYIRYRTPSGQSDTPTGSDVSVTHLVEVTQAGTPQARQFVDLLGRTVRNTTEAFSGTNPIKVDVRFDSLGRTVSESNPYISSSDRTLTTYSGYDALNRPGSKVTPGTESSESFTTTYTYSDLTTTINTSAADGHDLTMSRTYNSLQQLMETTDAEGGKTQYRYDGAGNPVVIKDATNLSIMAQYDGLGRKAWVDDPNQGYTSFTYNDFGEVERESHDGGDTIDYDMDRLGRVTARRTNNGQDATFVWDTQKTGQLTRESVTGLTKRYTYDNASRVTSTEYDLPGQGQYSIHNEYDQNYGRVKAMEYPSGLKVKLEYNAKGYLFRESNAASDYIYREVTAQDAWNNITEASLTDSLLTGTYDYSKRTGQMLSAEVGAVHHLAYTNYDSYGNLITRENLVTGREASETFVYDRLHRINSASVAGEQAVHYGYDAIGNLLKKTDFSANQTNAYSYAANSNKVSAVELKGNDGTMYYAYDAKGNMTGQQLGSSSNIPQLFHYNAFNKPTRIIRHGADLSFEYGADLARYKQERTFDDGGGSQTITTYYIGGIYEFEVSGDTTTSRTFISDVAVINETGNEGAISFTHRDRLGSPVTMTDGNGDVASVRSFDAFGKPRLGDWTLAEASTLAPRLSNIDTRIDTRRGFTDHEHLDEVELIHMNGRVYDYNLGRFMSADPFIQGVGNSQGINPYSYVMNNPLSFVDPTGYVADDVGNEEPKPEPKSSGDNSGDEDDGGGLNPAPTMTGNDNAAKNFQNYKASTAVMDMNSQEGIAQQGSSEDGSGGLSSDQLFQIYSDTASTIANGAAAAVGNLIPDMVNGIVDWTERFLHEDSGSLGRMDQWVDVDNDIVQGVANDIRKVAAVGTAMVPVIRTSTSTSLMGQLSQQGIKHNPANIVQIGKNADGKIIFLETGNANAGLQHIIQRHGADFANRGISQAQIPQAVMAAVTRGKFVGYQGKGTGRPIYEVGFGGQTHRMAVTTGSNGFIVGANPAR